MSARFPRQVGATMLAGMVLVGTSAAIARAEWTASAEDGFVVTLNSENHLLGLFCTSSERYFALVTANRLPLETGVAGGFSLTGSYALDGRPAGPVYAQFGSPAKSAERKPYELIFWRENEAQSFEETISILSNKAQLDVVLDEVEYTFDLAGFGNALARVPQCL